MNKKLQFCLVLFMNAACFSSQDASESHSLIKTELPSRIDYSKYVTLKYDQVGGGCGGATDATVVNILKEMEAPCTPDLSLRFLHYVFNDSMFLHLDNRITHEGLDQAGTIIKYGCCSETTWPYIKHAFPDPDAPPDVAFEEASLYKILKLSDPVMTPDVNTVRQMLAEYGPLVGIGGGHAFAVIGYDDGNHEFIYLNSWGDWWKDKGYLHVPYNKIRNPLGDDHFFDLNRVHYILNEPNEIGHRFTGRIRIQTENGRKYLTVKVYAEGQPPTVVWMPREKDRNKELYLDFPLPEYAEKFWPPSKKYRWFVEVSDASPGSAAEKAATIEEVMLVKRIRKQNRWQPQARRAKIKRLGIAHGGKIIIGIPTERQSLR